MTKEKTVYLEYLDEFKSYGIPKSEIEALHRDGVVADIRFHKELYEKGKPPARRSDFCWDRIRAPTERSITPLA